MPKLKQTLTSAVIETVARATVQAADTYSKDER